MFCLCQSLFVTVTGIFLFSFSFQGNIQNEIKVESLILTHGSFLVREIMLSLTLAEKLYGL